MEPIRLLVADGQRLFADALACALGGLEGIQVCDPRPTGGLEALRAAVRLKPDVAVLDLWLQGMGGAAACAAISSKRPSCAVVVLSWFHSRDDVQRAFDAGARGFLSKRASLSEVARAVVRAGEGEEGVGPAGDESLAALVRSAAASAAGPERAEIREGWERVGGLTPREIEVLTALGISGSLDAVASTLGMSTQTARTHIERILRKLQATTQVEALAAAARYGLIEA